jgi:hypothetical protein
MHDVLVQIFGSGGVEVKASEVFLISASRAETKVGGRTAGAAAPVQFVVEAADLLHAYELLAERQPEFAPLGGASLQQYEAAARQIRAALAGDFTEWPVIRATAH